MTANATAVTKLLKRYNFNKAAFTSTQYRETVVLGLADAIAYNNDLSIRLVEILENSGYNVELSGRRMVKLTKVGA